MIDGTDGGSDPARGPGDACGAVRGPCQTPSMGRSSSGPRGPRPIPSCGTGASPGLWAFNEWPNEKDIREVHSDMEERGRVPCGNTTCDVAIDFFGTCGRLWSEDGGARHCYCLGNKGLFHSDESIFRLGMPLTKMPDQDAAHMQSRNNVELQRSENKFCT